jgi:hypothetical protein
MTNNGKTADSVLQSPSAAMRAIEPCANKTVQEYDMDIFQQFVHFLINATASRDTLSCNESRISHILVCIPKNYMAADIKMNFKVFFIYQTEHKSKGLR